jgi:glycosyltransferase involved in cell wall biosynthesis
MSMGLPLVVTAVGAIPDTVQQPDLPPLAPGDAEALESALVRLADDPGLRVRCADANIRRTREYLSPNVVVPLYIDMWRTAAHPRRRVSAAWSSSEEFRSA